MARINEEPFLYSDSQIADNVVKIALERLHQTGTLDTKCQACGCAKIESSCIDENYWQQKIMEQRRIIRERKSKYNE